MTRCIQKLVLKRSVLLLTIAVFTTVLIYSSFHNPYYFLVSMGASTKASSQPTPDGNNVTSHIDDRNETKQQKWNVLKEIICPNMVPNENIRSLLFELARVEIGFAKERMPTNPLDANFTKQFFTFSSGGVGYTSADKLHHVVYLRVWKAGNDQIRKNLMSTLSDKDDGSKTWEKKGRLLEAFDTGWPGLWSPIPKTHLNQTCIVTAVRDPISHFLSGYNEMEYRVAAHHPGHQWTTRQNPHPNHFARFENGREIRFEQFITDLVGGAASSSNIFPSMPHWNIYHVFSMTGVLWELKRLRDTLGVVDAIHLTDYLPTVDNLNTEFPKFLSQTCNGIPLAAEKPWNTTLGDHESREDEYGFYNAAKRVWKNQDEISRALCAIHTLDYACFDKLPIPDLCQSLYTSDRFYNELIKADKGKGGSKTNS